MNCCSRRARGGRRRRSDGSGARRVVLSAREVRTATLEEMVDADVVVIAAGRRRPTGRVPAGLAARKRRSDRRDRRSGLGRSRNCRRGNPVDVLTQTDDRGVRPAGRTRHQYRHDARYRAPETGHRSARRGRSPLRSRAGGRRTWRFGSGAVDGGAGWRRPSERLDRLDPQRETPWPRVRRAAQRSSAAKGRPITPSASSRPNCCGASFATNAAC